MKLQVALNNIVPTLKKTFINDNYNSYSANRARTAITIAAIAVAAFVFPALVYPMLYIALTSLAVNLVFNFGKLLNQSQILNTTRPSVVRYDRGITTQDTEITDLKARLSLSDTAKDMALYELTELQSTYRGVTAELEALKEAHAALEGKHDLLRTQKASVRDSANSSPTTLNLAEMSVFRDATSKSTSPTARQDSAKNDSGLSDLDELVDELVDTSSSNSSTSPSTI